MARSSPPRRRRDESRLGQRARKPPLRRVGTLCTVGVIAVLAVAAMVMAMLPGKRGGGAEEELLRPVFHVYPRKVRAAGGRRRGRA